MAIFNLTPHPLTIVNAKGEAVAFPKPDAGVSIPRVETRTEVVNVVDGITVYKTVFGEVVNLPEPKDGDFYIVSRLVISACADRNIPHDHLLAPGHLLRDEEGKIIGAEGLSR